MCIIKLRFSSVRWSLRLAKCDRNFAIFFCKNCFICDSEMAWMLLMLVRFETMRFEIEDFVLTVEKHGLKPEFPMFKMRYYGCES